MDNFNLKKFIGEKSLLNESSPGYDTRKFGGALPTLESVKAAYEAKECKCGKGETCKCNDIKEDASNNLVEDIIERLKDADLDGETMQYILEKIGMDYQMYKQLNVKYDDEVDADEDAMASIMMDAPDRFEEGEKIVPPQPSDERVIDIIKKMAPKTKIKFLEKLAKIKNKK